MLKHYIRGIGKVISDALYRVRMIAGSKRRYTAARKNSLLERAYIVCYPDRPNTMHSFYELCHALGLTITNTLRSDAATFVHFEDVTKRPMRPELIKAAAGRKIINGMCTDISKEKVEEIFGDVFGYGMKIDPRTHDGICVKKADRNSADDTSIVQCPCEPEPGYVYQKLIDSVEGDTAVTLRVSVFGDTLPLTYLRYKHVNDRFGSSVGCVRVPTQNVLSSDEQEKTIRFCKRLGLDYGELDIMRDTHDGRMYIVDANNTPYSPQTPPRQLDSKEHDVFIAVSRQHFITAFLSDKS